MQKGEKRPSYIGSLLITNMVLVSFSDALWTSILPKEGDVDRPLSKAKSCSAQCTAVLNMAILLWGSKCCPA